MAVAFVSTTSAAAGSTAATFTSGTWNISGTSSPVIVIYIGLNDAAGVINSVSWSLGSGTALQIKSFQCTGGNLPFVSVWAVPAPTTGSGTYTVNWSHSVAYQISADLFSGADQTTPCPTGDAVTAGSTNWPAANTVSLAPTNVGANDATGGCVMNALNGDALGWGTGTQTFLNDTSVVNFETAYKLGASATVVSVAPGGGGAASVSAAGVRIQASSVTSSGRPLPLFEPIPFMSNTRI